MIMINLLPPSAKKIVSHERKAKFFSVLCLGLSLAFVVSIVFSIPIWIVQDYQLNTIREDKEFTVEVEEERKRREAENKEIQSIIQHIERQANSRNYTNIMAVVDELAGDSIRVDRFVFDEKNKLSLMGVASTRPALSEFRNQLEAHADFSSVEMPLSSLVNERDAVFNITLKLK